MFGVIYKITFPNNKVYIGQTKNLEERKKSHYKECFRRNRNLPVYYAMRKYGWDNLIWDVIDEAENQEELNLKEQHWIEFYHSYCGDKSTAKGYNATRGGEGHTSSKYDKKHIDLLVLKHQEHPEWNAVKLQKELKKIDETFNISVDYLRSIIYGRKLVGLTHVTALSSEENRERLASRATQLNKEQAIKIYQLHKEEGLSPLEIFNKTGYGNPKAISCVLTGVTWSRHTGAERTQKRKVNFLTEEKVLEVLRLKEEGMSRKEISKQTNIPYNTLGNVFRGEVWSWLTGIQPKNQHKKSVETTGNAQ